VRFNKDGNYCLSGGTDRSMRLWNPHKGTLIKTYKGGHGNEILDFSITGDNSRIASCGGDRSVFLWDVASGQIIRQFSAHAARVNAVRFNEDTSVLVTASYDRTIKIWDLKSRSFVPIQSLEEAKDSVSSLILTDHQIMAGSVDGCVRTYDIRMGTLTADHLGQSVTSITPTADGNCIVSSCLDSTVKLLDKSSGEILNEYKGHANTNYKIDNCATKDDAFILSGSEDNNVYTWDLVHGKLVQTLKGHTNAVCSLSFHPTETCLVTSSFDSTVRVWR